MKKLGGAVYILPNLVTSGGLFCGFYSIGQSLKGEFYVAAIAILLASIFDMLDGRVARMTNGTSEFGVQYDSLCDLLSFGCAPAILMFQFGLYNFPKIGWALCFLYLALGAVRLARFNVQSALGKASGDFTGLPIPMAAIFVACYVALCADIMGGQGEQVNWFYDYLYPVVANDQWRSYFLFAAAPALGIAMISNVAYRSHKVLKASVISPFKLLVLLIIILAVAALQPEAFGFVVALLYVLSGPFEWLVGWKKPIDDDDIFMSQGADKSIMYPEDEN